MLKRVTSVIPVDGEIEQDPFLGIWFIWTIKDALPVVTPLFAEIVVMVYSILYLTVFKSLVKSEEKIVSSAVLSP